jgi:hypothetical protein
LAILAFGAILPTVTDARTEGGKIHFMKSFKTKTTARTKKQSGPVSEAYRTRRGKMLVARIEDALHSAALKAVRGKVNLIFTSPISNCRNAGELT